jgi:hypothetical protein
MSNYIIAKVPSEKLTATQFIESVKNLKHSVREDLATKLFLEGQIPDRFRLLKEISIVAPVSIAIGKFETKTFKFFVSNDYLTLGTDADFLRFPLNPLNAQKVADEYNCTLPTEKLVTLIWNAGKKINPRPWGPPYNQEMLSLKRYVDHDKMINASIEKLKYDFSDLLVGHKKDVVLSNRLVSRPKQVAIFGWHQSNGKPIQPVSLIHENTYSDYAHGVRLISNTCFIDNEVHHLHDLFKHDLYHKIVSSEGKLLLNRQPRT